MALEKDRLENILTFTEEERQELTSTIESNSGLQEQLDKDLTVLNEVIQLKSDINDSTKRLEKKKVESKSLGREIEAFKVEADRRK